MKGLAMRSFLLTLMVALAPAAAQAGAAEVVASWLGSAGHQKNILNCAFVETGLAVVHDPNDAPLQGYSHPLHFYWVQTFGRP